MYFIQWTEHRGWYYVSSITLGICRRRLYRRPLFLMCCKAVMSNLRGDAAVPGRRLFGAGDRRALWLFEEGTDRRRFLSPRGGTNNSIRGYCGQYQAPEPDRPSAVPHEASWLAIGITGTDNDPAQAPNIAHSTLRAIPNRSSFDL